MLTEIPTALESIQCMQVIAYAWCVTSRRFPYHGLNYMAVEMPL